MAISLYAVIIFSGSLVARNTVVDNNREDDNL